jgi:DNA-directed RNA polymerase subunit RPC12/RpoP
MTIEIIQQGKIPNVKKKKTCGKCNTVFSFDRSDIEQDRDGRFVRCPVCNSFIGVQQHD